MSAINIDHGFVSKLQQTYPASVKDKFVDIKPTGSFFNTDFVQGKVQAKNLLEETEILLKKERNRSLSIFAILTLVFVTILGFVAITPIDIALSCFFGICSMTASYFYFDLKYKDKTLTSILLMDIAIISINNYLILTNNNKIDVDHDNYKGQIYDAMFLYHSTQHEYDTLRKLVRRKDPSILVEHEKTLDFYHDAKELNIIYDNTIQ